MNKGDMILVYKILHGSSEDIQWRDFFQMADTSRLRGHSLKMKKERSRLDLRKFTFRLRVVNMWNDPPAAIVTAPTAKVDADKMKTGLYRDKKTVIKRESSDSIHFR